MNAWSSVRELGKEKSKAFRDEMSHVLRMSVIPRIEKILDDTGIYDRGERVRFARKYCQVLRDDLDLRLDWIFQDVAMQILPWIIGDTQGNMTDVVFSQWAKVLTWKLESWWIFSWVLQYRDELLQILQVLRPLWWVAYNFFDPKTHHIDANLSDGSNFISPFDRFLPEEILLASSATVWWTEDKHLGEVDPLFQSRTSLEEDREKLLDLIYNKILLEWFLNKGSEFRFKHSLHLIDEPSLKRWVKWETREWIYFLPIDIFLTHGVVSFLSRWVFDFSSEEDIENAAQELDEVEDLENFASVLKDQILGQVLPYISQISVKAPFLDWIKSKINSEEIKRILLLIKNHKKDRNKVTMNNIYWLLWVDKEMQVKKAYFIDFL